MEAITEKVAKGLSLESAAVVGPSRVHAITFARREVIRNALAQGFKPSEIAKFLNVTPSVVSKALARETGKQVKV